MYVKIPTGIIVLVNDEPLKVLPSITEGSCKGCHFAYKACDFLCNCQNLIFTKTDEPFVEDITRR